MGGGAAGAGVLGTAGGHGTRGVVLACAGEMRERAPVVRREGVSVDLVHRTLERRESGRVVVGVHCGD
jgi:hypothetical protein